MVMAEVDRSEINIGDRILYTITVISKPDLTIDFPQISENLGGLTLEDFGSDSPERSRESVRRDGWYRLYTYKTGSYTIPPPVIVYSDDEGKGGEIKGGEVKVEVVSLIPEGEEPEDIRDIKPPVGLPVNYLPFILLGVGGLIIVGGLVGLWFFLKKRRRPILKEEEEKPAHIIAYEGLDHILSLRLIEQGRIEEYYVLLSDVVRRYLENRFGLRAPEMTTEEFLDILRGSHELAAEHKLLLDDFLSSCDLVKFARYGPNPTEIENVYLLAKRLVDETVDEVSSEASDEAGDEVSSKTTDEVSSKTADEVSSKTADEKVEVQESSI